MRTIVVKFDKLTRRYVVNDIAIQVGHDHDVELVRIGDKLHAAIIDNHGFKLDVWIVFGNVSATLKKLSIGELHNVGLMNSRHFLATIADGVIESEFGDTFAFCSEKKDVRGA